jgi:ATP-dependent helicase/DNAse subunit B
MLLESRNPVNPAWNEYNGNLSQIKEKVSARFYGKPQSSSGLEKWLKNPIEYLMTNLLGVDVLEDIDGSKRMQPNVKGSIVHNALEDWVNEILEAKVDEQWLWSIEALLAKADIHLKEARAAHPAWLQVIFEADSELIKYELSEVHSKWLIPERGVWDFRSAELAFGMDPEREPKTLPPIEIPIDDSHTLLLRGKIDRVDEQVTDGVLNLRVIDYKTGSSKELKDGLKLSGEYIQKIQLPIYGKLAKQILADQKGYVAGVAQLQYWFTSVKGGFVDSGESQLSGDIEQVFDKTMLEIASQITNGVFPGINSEDDYKPFVTVSDRIGKFSLSALWNGLKSKAELSELKKLKGLKEGEE